PARAAGGRASPRDRWGECRSPVLGSGRTTTRGYAMASVNKVILLGNLGADPEVRFTPSGQAVANFRLATTDSWTDKATGQRQERTEWQRIVVWGKLGELCGEYLRKGRQCYVEGRLQTREWQDRDGQRRWTTEIVASEVVFLGGRGDGAPASGSGGGFGGGRPAPDYGGERDLGEGFDNGDDEIPF